MFSWQILLAEKTTLDPQANDGVLPPSHLKNYTSSYATPAQASTPAFQNTLSPKDFCQGPSGLSTNDGFQNRVDLWSEIIAEEEGGGGRQSLQQQQQQPIYQRRRRQTTPQNQITSQDANLKQLELKDKDIRVSFGGGGGGRATKRVSWNRSLSTRGRISIAVAACVDNQPQQKQARKRGNPPVPKCNLPILRKKKQYFEEVDAFELLEESPSPKNSITWATGNETDAVYTVEDIRNSNHASLGPMSGDDFSIVDVITPEKAVFETNSKLHSVHSRIRSYLPSKGVLERNSLAQKSSSMFVGREGCEDIEGAVKKLSLASTSSLSDHDYVDPVTALLAVCGQSVPSTLLERILSKSVKELMEKHLKLRSEELLEEAILSRTLNNLRSHDADFDNSCTTFIETLDLRVCQGPYDPALVKAWEYWDEKHGSENDHPKEFPEKQCYVVFVLQHGGKDLESFVLLNFDEAQSLLVQVTAGLAVAEAAYEFEHRDLHWGNILLRRN
ncbi:serine/threonine-protein kinase haspin [Populus alba x Populus x berolinensis]|nr:serine/threonine-protein kinase haspin [Populus alba x Populus x berolinensis]